MPSFTWYLNRLKTMSAQEIGWRLRDTARDATDRFRFASARYPSETAIAETVGAAPPCRLTDIPIGAWRDRLDEPIAGWRDSLVKRADQLRRHELTFFNLEARFAGNPIDWNRDLESGRPAPRTFAPTIDYRDAQVAGDAKVVWEPNRHQHLVVLARAYRATGDERYAREAVEQLTSWLDASPFGYGMNWRSPLELGVRIINWVWTLDLIRESGLVTGTFERRIRHAIHLHVWETQRKYSRGSSANNHLIGEAAGVFVATGYFPEMPGHREWHDESRQILQRELFAQTYEDGGTAEQAPGYLVFVLQFYLAAGLLARRLGRDFPPDVWRRIEQTTSFLAALLEGGSLPLLGDADDGLVLDLGGGGKDPVTVVAAGASLFNRDDFRRVSSEGSEWAYWLLGPGALEGDAVRSDSGKRQPLQSRAFPQMGYYLLQAGHVAEPDAVSLLFDCAELGFGALAAHGHADALSFVLRLGGIDILVDPGTYDYFTYPEWRKYLRGTRAHNTITVDGQDQSVLTGPFMWGTRATTRLLEWQPSANGGIVSGEHDGYTRLADPVVHRRQISLDAAARTVLVRDEISAQGSHVVELNLHFSEHCQVTLEPGGSRIEAAGNRLQLALDPRLEGRLVPPTDAPEGGWVSRGYHRRTAAPFLVARATTNGGAAFETTIRY